MAPLNIRRNDIDLLRAIAVMAVIFFHLDIPLFMNGLFESGFLGVDIFFVISGYLITKQIINSHEGGVFQLSVFYARRIRRLAPAFLAVLFITSILAIVLMSPSQIERLSGSVKFTSVYLSNFFFWLESGYFDSSSITKPLLHTWSLAVEEQFYLVWPLLLLFLVGKRLWFWLAVLGLVSLLFVELMRDSHSDMMFYLMPFRVFEFAIGALIIPVERKLTNIKHTKIILVVCLGIIIYSCSLLDKSWNTMGVAALPVLLATALMIALKLPELQKDYYCSWFVSWTGRISYSLYLVHWPLVVFYRIKYGENLHFYDILILLSLSYLLASALYYAVEQPSQKLNLKPKWWYCLLPVGGLFALFFSTYGNTLYKELRVDRQALDDLLLAIPDRAKEANHWWKSVNGINKLRGDKALILGDSHSFDLYMGLKYGDKQIDAISFAPGCDPVFIDENKADLGDHYAEHEGLKALNEDCVDYHRVFFQRINQWKPDIVLFSERWRIEALPYLQKTLYRLQNEFGIKCIVFGTNQEFYGIPDVVLAKVSRVDEINNTAWAMRKDKSLLNAQLKKITEAAGATYIDKSEAVCPNEDECDYYYQGKLMYSDNNHWTPTGMKLFVQRLVNTQKFQSVWPTNTYSSKP